MKLYLWDQAAREFCKKFKSYEGTPTVLLVTTVNTKTLGGTLALTSMSSSRVFMDYDVQPTIDYFSWLGSNPDIAEQVNAEVVTKRETMTIGDIFSYIEQEPQSARPRSTTSCMVLLGTTLPAVGAIVRLAKVQLRCSAQTRSVERLTYLVYQFMTTVTKLFLFYLEMRS
ncbi:unnamed protein product [Brassica napus]|uniref:(rape) hypothetical protein n=1 Tax=Brassica napus TaxID=3708 RepID=A0A816SCN3_BRANA|nr:unnamed protein product [Brassica napus]